MCENVKYCKNPEIPDFKLTECCGRGTAGEVWLGRDSQSTLRAVRLIRKQNHRALLQKERQGILLYLNLRGKNDHLLEIFSFGETEEFLYCIMEPADNIADSNGHYAPDTLAERINSRKENADTLLHLDAILSGVEQLHSQNIFHGDLKPENILFVKNVLKIADPGLAAPADMIPAGGSAGFRPPWNADGMECDIYAVGKLIYMLCTHESPARFPDIPEKYDLKKFLPLNEIALRCCERNPRFRFRSMAEVHQAFDRVRNRFPETA